MAVFWGLTLSWAQAADASDPVSKFCVFDHFQTDRKAPHQWLCGIDGAPSDEQFLKESMNRLKEDPKNISYHLVVAIAYLKQADPTKWDYLDKAKKHLKKAKAKFPNDPYILMYLGRATGAQALNLKPSVFTRLKLAREGFRLMDRAVKQKPDCMWLRLLRGEAQLMAHPILRRKERLRKDAAHIEKFTQAKEFKLLSPYQQAKLHLFMGCYLEKTKAEKSKYQTEWKLAAEKGGVTAIGKEAKARLGGQWQDIGYSGEESP